MKVWVFYGTTKSGDDSVFRRFLAVAHSLARGAFDRLAALVDHLFRNGLLSQHVSQNPRQRFHSRSGHAKPGNDADHLPCAAVTFHDESAEGKAYDPVRFSRFGNNVYENGHDIIGVNYSDHEIVREFNNRALGHVNLLSPVEGSLS